MKTHLRKASGLDAGKIAMLVNRAYRPLASERGWTHEANLVSGQRTTEEQVLSLFHARSTILVLCLDSGTGETASYPVSAGIGEPMVDGLEVELMVKKLARTAYQFDNQPNGSSQ